MNQLTLYGYFLCPYVQRARFALEALKIDYEYVQIDLNANGQKSEAYLKINPFGKVPSIKANGQIIYESITLIEFISDRFGNILPKDDVVRAHQRIWANYFDQNVINKIWPLFHLKKANNQEGFDKQIKEILENIKFFTKNSGLEQQIKKNSKFYFNGEKLSYVDFVIGPFIRVLELFFKQFIGKSVYSYTERSEALDAYQIYAQNVTQSQPYLAITDKLKVLPPISTNSLFKELRIDTLDRYNYEQIFRDYYIKKLS